MNESYDLIIVGGGPAGLTSALYALRAEKTVLILEKSGFGGQIATSPRVENFPGTPTMSGAAFSDRLLTQVTALGGEIDLCEVSGITDNGCTKLVHTTDGDYTAVAIILATGAQHRHLGLPREEELAGKGIAYCAVCDGVFNKDLPVAVIGGGNAAVQDAILLSNYCSDVYIIHRGHEFSAEAANVRVLLERKNIHLLMSTCIVDLLGDDALNGIVIENTLDGSKSPLNIDGLFIAVGYQPDNLAFAAIAGLDSAGWFTADETCITCTPGVFVAGDCRAKEVRQLTTAAGDGAVAAIAACRFIDSLER